jgi:hypothetical protein
MAVSVAAGADPVALEPGISVTLASAVAAAQVLGQAGLTATRLTNPLFSVFPRGDGGDRTLNLNVRSATAVPTTVTASLYQSTDNGVTWELAQPAFNLVQAGVVTGAQALHLVAGVLYQLLVTSLALGSATTVSVDGSVS